jgi:flagellar hook-associated protein 2
MPINLSGLASGLDTEAIVTQLMALEQNKVTAVQRRQIGVQQHKDDLSAIKTKLDAFKAAAAALSDTATWKATQTTTSSDPAKIDVSLLGGAGIGGHSIQVNKLASSAQHGFTYVPSTSAGSLTLHYGDDPNLADINKVTISIPANATAAEMATAINANEGAPVYAAVIKENGGAERLVLSARKTGEHSDFSVDTSALGAGATMTEEPAYERVGAAVLNASYVLDGEALPRASESNIIENAIPGVRLTLKGVTNGAESVTTTSAAIDKDGVSKKVKALVDAYNAVVTTVRAELTEKSDPKATTTAALQKGKLFGDSGLTTMLSQLKGQMTQVVTGLGLTGLADLGIDIPKSTGAASSEDAKAGKLDFDTEKLTKALDADWTKVRDLFAGKGATKGISGLLGDYVATQTNTTGVLTGRMTSDDSVLKDFTTQITKLQERMKMTEARLKAQFAAMETALNNSQTQQAWLTSQISTLPTLG